MGRLRRREEVMGAEEKVISLGVGDVTLPLPKAVTDAMQKAVLDQTKKETFQGYGPYEGFEFLRR